MDREEGMWMGKRECGGEEGVWTGRKWRRRGGDRAGMTSDQPSQLAEAHPGKLGAKCTTGPVPGPQIFLLGLDTHMREYAQATMHLACP